MISSWLSDGKGRRATLKKSCPYGRAGSTPVLATNQPGDYAK